LAHLLIRANELVSAEALIDEIWGEEPPDAARGSLHSYISHLKKALGAERLISRPPGYVLRVHDEELDAARFEILAGQARRRQSTDPAGAARALREALSLWQGEPFADLANELSLAPEIERLSELRLAAIEDRLEAELALGRHAELISELERLVARHPLRERLAGQLMLALYRSGRQAEALAAYHRLRTTLDEDLGLQPSPAVEQLQTRILNQDPTLELAGAPLRGYRLVEQIGAGPLGVVHRAFEPQTEREVAVKVLSAAVANDPDFVRRFDAEARRIARLEHPHIAPLLDWWREPDAAYVVMPLLRGGTLTERLAGRQLGSQQALRWVEQLAGALDAAHRQGVSHGDIRPGNVLLDVEGNAYLADFLLGIDTSAGGHQHEAEDRYLAPERRDGQPPSVAADVYALGTITLELLEATSSGDRITHDVVERARSPSPEERPTAVTELVIAVRRALLEPSSDAAPADAFPAAGRNPYKGLRPFEEADSADFHGREQLVSELVEQMRQGARLLAVVGPSGSGKSSVVNAGLVPALRSEGLPGSGRWYVAQMTPGDRPFDKLEESLKAVAIGAPVSPAELLATDAGLGPAIDRILPADEQLVLVIDQFEELFTLVTDEDVRQSFLTLLGRTTGDQSARLRTVITLRADFYDRPLRHELFGRFLAAGTVPLPPLTPEGLARAITGPAGKAGLELDDGLVARLVSDMTQQPASLPLLQYALTELWERRDGRRLSVRAYGASGGIGGAIARRSDQLVRDLDAAGREAARQVFLRLIELGEGTPDTARRVLLGDLRALSDDARRVDGVIERFARYRLLLFDRDAQTRQPVVELAHESLLRAWPRLQQWIDEARDDLRQQRRLTGAAGQWLDGQRDPSFLLTGSRLEQAVQWADGARIALSPLDREYLAASLAERDRLAAEHEQREAREAALERRAVSRLRALVVTFALGAVLAGVLSVFAFAESQRAEREARTATARELAAAALANLDVDPERSIMLALAAVDRTRSADGTVLREAEDALHWAVVSSRAVLTVPDEGGYVAWAESQVLGSIFVTEGPEESGIVNVRDALTGEVLRSWHAHAIDVNDVAFNRDGTLLATTGDDGQLVVWNVATAAEVARLSGPSGHQVWGPSFSSDGAFVAANWTYEHGDTGATRVLSIATGELVLELDDLGTPWRTAFSPDGARLAVAFEEGHVALVFELSTGAELFVLEGHGGPLRDVEFSPDGQWIATASDDTTAAIWDSAGQFRYTLFGHAAPVKDLAWSHDSVHLVTGSEDGTARIWAALDEGPLALNVLSSQDLRGGVGGVAVSPDGTRVLTGQNATTAIKIWDLSPAGDAEWRNLPGGNGLGAIAFSPVSGELVASTDDDSIAVWNVETGSSRLNFGGHDNWVFAVEVSPDGTLAASAGWDGARVWSTATGEVQHIIPLGADEPWIQTLAWDPTSQFLATASVAGSVIIRDRSGSEVAHLPEGPGVSVWAARFSPDGQQLATAVKHAYGQRYDLSVHRVSIWDWRAQQRVATIPTSSLGLAFDPTGTLLATSHVDGGYAEIWELATRERKATLVGHSGRVGDVAWSPDPARDWIATAGNDGTIRLWNATNWTTELVLRGHEGLVWQVRFSADGSRLVSVGPDGRVRVWAMNLDDLIEIARAKLTRALTDEECRQYLHLERCPAD
jgi:WD40 repeat protein/DNA-binding SARP family transcriptional activator